MSNARPFLLIALAMLGFMLYQQWQLDFGPKPPAPSVEERVDLSAESPDTIPVLTTGDSTPAAVVDDDSVPTLNATAEPVSEPTAAGDAITITTDVLELKINTIGGEVEHVTLLDYPVELKAPEQKVVLLNREQRFVAQSGLISSSHNVRGHAQPYQTAQTEYALSDNSDELVVPLTWRSDDGVLVTKTFRFTRGGYAIDVEHSIDNQSDTAFVGAQYQQLQRYAPADEKKSYSDPSRFSFLGGGLYSEAQRYEEFELDDFDSVRYEQQQATWVAMIQHYFLAAWIPPADQPTTLETQQLGSGASTRYLVRGVSNAATVAAGTQGQLNTTLWVGPKLQEPLDELADGLELTVDYGIFTPLSKVLFWIMKKIHSFVGNWGLAIVLLTVVVKAIFYKLSEAQYRATAKQRKLQPRITALRERFGDDKQKLNMEIMQLFQKEKVNPLGGCLPLLVQMPVFFALYWVLLESVELRQAPFMLWLQDLSSPDPFFVLPIINGAAMWATMKLSPNPMADPIQQRIFTAMPVIMSIMFAFFQSGLVLYWATNAVLSLVQQWYITRKIDREGV